MVATEVADANVQQALSGVPPKAIWLKLEHGPGMHSVAVDAEGGMTLWYFRFWDRLNLLACSGPVERVPDVCPGWTEPGGRRSIQLVLPDSAYAAVGATGPRPRARG